MRDSSDLFSASNIMTEKELALMEESRGFSKVTEETKRSIYEECRQMLAGKLTHRVVCAVCDSWTPEEKCLQREGSEDFYSRLRVILLHLMIFHHI